MNQSNTSNWYLSQSTSCMVHWVSCHVLFMLKQITPCSYSIIGYKNNDWSQ